MALKRDYWVDVCFDGVDYHLGADLAWHGECEEDLDHYVVHKHPTFHKFVIFDRDDNVVEDYFGLGYNIVKAAQAHLGNVYWNETLGN